MPTAAANSSANGMARRAPTATVVVRARGCINLLYSLIHVCEENPPILILRGGPW